MMTFFVLMFLCSALAITGVFRLVVAIIEYRIDRQKFSDALENLRYSAITQPDRDGPLLKNVLLLQGE